MIIISPSILSANFARLEDEIKKIEATRAKYLHVDVMDGIFVPNISFGQPVVKAIRGCTDLFFDVHLMIDRPIRYVEEFAAVGADLITIHAEAENNIAETLDKIHSIGKKTGLSIKPNTPVEVLYPYLDKMDLALIMTVEPGFGGQSFIESTLPKIAALRRYIDERGIACDIEVDGGINDKTVRIAAEHGANIFVAGSYVFGASSANDAVESLLSAAEQSSPLGNNA